MNRITRIALLAAAIVGAAIPLSHAGAQKDSR